MYKRILHFKVVSNTYLYEVLEKTTATATQKRHLKTQDSKKNTEMKFLKTMHLKNTGKTPIHENSTHKQVRKNKT